VLLLELVELLLKPLLAFALHELKGVQPLSRALVKQILLLLKAHLIVLQLGRLALLLLDWKHSASDQSPLLVVLILMCGRVVLN